MKKILIISFLTNFFFLSAQTFDTNYIRGKTSTFCAEEFFSFEFDYNTFTKIDSYSGKEIYGYSKVSETNYDNSGYYYELRTADFVLNESVSKMHKDLTLNEFRELEDAIKQVETVSRNAEGTGRKIRRVRKQRW